MLTRSEKREHALKSSLIKSSTIHQIEDMILFLFPIDELPMVCLDHILRNSRRSLDSIIVQSGQPLSLDQSRVIAAGLGGALLGHVKTHCRFEDEGIFQQIVLACTRV